MKRRLSPLLIIFLLASAVMAAPLSPELREASRSWATAAAA